MKNEAIMTEARAFEDDVKTMTHEDLMDAIRFLDEERNRIAGKVHAEAEQNNVRDSKIIKRVA